MPSRIRTDGLPTSPPSVVDRIGEQTEDDRRRNLQTVADAWDEVLDSMNKSMPFALAPIAEQDEDAAEELLLAGTPPISLSSSQDDSLREYYVDDSHLASSPLMQNRRYNESSRLNLNQRRRSSDAQHPKSILIPTYLDAVPEDVEEDGFSDNDVSADDPEQFLSPRLPSHSDPDAMFDLSPLSDSSLGEDEDDFMLDLDLDDATLFDLPGSPTSPLSPTSPISPLFPTSPTSFQTNPPDDQPTPQFRSRSPPLGSSHERPRHVKRNSLYALDLYVPSAFQDSLLNETLPEELSVACRALVDDPLPFAGDDWFGDCMSVARASVDDTEISDLDLPASLVPFFQRAELAYWSLRRALEEDDGTEETRSIGQTPPITKSDVSGLASEPARSRSSSLSRCAPPPILVVNGGDERVFDEDDLESLGGSQEADGDWDGYTHAVALSNDASSAEASKPCLTAVTESNCDIRRVRRRCDSLLSDGVEARIRCSILRQEFGTFSAHLEPRDDVEQPRQSENDQRESNGEIKYDVPVLSKVLPTYDDDSTPTRSTFLIPPIKTSTPSSPTSNNIDSVRAPATPSSVLTSNVSISSPASPLRSPTSTSRSLSLLDELNADDDSEYDSDRTVRPGDFYYRRDGKKALRDRVEHERVLKWRAMSAASESLQKDRDAQTSPESQLPSPTSPISAIRTKSASRPFAHVGPGAPLGITKKRERKTSGLREVVLAGPELI